MANCFGRPFAFNARDRVPVGGDYACVSCFYGSGASVKVAFQVGSNFAACESCKETLWIRVTK